MKSSSLQNVTEFGSALDWLTFTATYDDKEKAEFHHFAKAYMKSEEARWSETKNKLISNYVGIAVNESSWVKREHDGHEMLVASGATANRLAEEIIAHGIQGNVKRIDCQSTARTGKPDWLYPERSRSEIHRTRAKEGKERRKKVVLFDSPFGNSGCTVGARASQKYLRIYDWDAKHGSGASGTLWRHEAEFKEGAAKACFEGYRNSTNRAAYCSGVVRNTLESMDVRCDWLKDVDAVGVVVGRKVTTDEKRLLYQQKIGIPMLQKLIANGHDEEVKSLLMEAGIDKLFS